MPELPEVETIVNGLKKKVLGRTFIDIWTDFPKNIRIFRKACKKDSLGKFRKAIRGEKIEKIKRRAKNILFFLSGDKILLVHQKMTGHLLYGKWEKKGDSWRSLIPGVLSGDFRNGFLHLIFFLDNGFQIALSDMRKFAKVELFSKKEFEEADEINSLGPEPLEKSFTLAKFKSILPKKGKIKQILMDQSVVAGIGNIYSDEVLWEAKIHPLREISKIDRVELRKIYKAIRLVLKKAIFLKGNSFSDYRMVNGEKGGYQNVQHVYGKEGRDCDRKDGGKIQRLKIGGRSAHFCPVCQV
jgi:formamidopyrimidine-DNA glycosylase